MSTKLPRCAHCARPFRPDRYNVHAQDCCTQDACVLERKRQRQREWYARRRATDGEFRARENARCAEANRKRRASIRARAGPSAAEGDPVVLFDVVTGLLSQVVDSTDPQQLQVSLRDYAARGRRVALLGCTCTDPP